MHDEAMNRNSEIIKPAGELDSLIKALRADGIEKGEAEAQRIVGEAKKEAARMIDEARTRAEKLEGDAHKKASATMERLQSQLSLALRDFILKVKNELMEVVALDPIRQASEQALSDPDFMKKLIEKMVEQGGVTGDGEGLTVAVPEDMQKSFAADWIKLMHDRLSAVVKIEKKPEGDGFSIAGDGGGMRITDAASIVEALRPFISEKFQYILDEGELPKG